MRRFPPERIVCLGAETVETLYLLGEENRIVGVTGHAVRPARVRREKPRVSAFQSADVPKILALEPDLVLTFSDVQAGIARELVAAGLAVHAFNQRDVAGILAAVRTLGALVGAGDRADALASRLARRLDAIAAGIGPGPRPGVYFEEWHEPMVSGIRWVSELVAIAGGRDVFEERSRAPAARDRIVSPADVVAAAPDIVVASWCGKRFRPDLFAGRDGFASIPAVRNGRLHEIGSPLILQPGPAALTGGLDALVAILRGPVGGRTRVDTSAGIGHKPAPS